LFCGRISHLIVKNLSRKTRQRNSAKASELTKGKKATKIAMNKVEF
jgi:hypothetical protein